MKQVLRCLLLCILVHTQAAAQCRDTLISGGGRGSDRSYSAKLDAADNLYFIGYYDSAASFSGIPLPANPLRTGVFLNKFDAQRQPVFVKDIAHLNCRTSLQPGVAVGGNDLYAYLYFVCDTFSVNGIKYNTGGRKLHSFVILHADLDGNITWQKLMQFRDMGVVTNWPSITADQEGNVYLAGNFSDTMRLDNFLLGSAGKQNKVFVAKIARDGTVRWARESADQPKGYTLQYHIHLSPDGRVLVGGVYNSNVSFGGPAAGATDTTWRVHGGFLAAFDTSGNFSWLNTTSAPTVYSGHSPFAAISDEAGDIYVAGGISDSIGFGNGVWLYGSRAERYLARYTAEGTLVWARKNLLHANPWGDAATGIAINHAGHLITTNVFFDSTYFGTQKFISKGISDIAIAEYDKDGVLLRVDAYGSAGLDDVQSPLIRSNDSVVIAGLYSGSSFTINGHTVHNSSNGGYEVFVYDRCIGNTVGIRSQSGIPEKLMVYPNPSAGSITLNFPKAVRSNAEVILVDCNGRTMLNRQFPKGTGSATLDLEDLPFGIYNVILKIDGKKFTAAILKD